MPRYRLTVEYDGTPYVGWQRQENGHTVQAAIEQAFKRFTGENLTLGTAGRTDAGVHALAQTAHVDLQRDWSAGKMREALNAHLAQSGERISILNVQKTVDRFDARFSARARHYLYRIHNRRPPLSVDLNRSWWVSKPLNHEIMHEAAQLLLGTHDFTTFRASQCQSKSPVKTLDLLDVTRHGEIIEIRASARSFLHNQVRSLAGSLMEVGSGRWTCDDLVAALEARDRARCGTVAPPYGLYLIGVDYDDPV
ncbi:tRNA pseudouridine(38-40) synthase TruA [Brucellaceae bacterium C25G]